MSFDMSTVPQSSDLLIERSKCLIWRRSNTYFSDEDMNAEMPNRLQSCSLRFKAGEVATWHRAELRCFAGGAEVKGCRYLRAMHRTMQIGRGHDAVAFRIGIDTSSRDQAHR
jgi:hypothetical protein